MLVSQKSQYALRAVLELAKRQGAGPVKIAEIAEVQAIPGRFLEVILSQLKRAGFVESKRGTEGGYFLVRQPGALTVGEVLRFVEGPIGPVACVTDDPDRSCPLRGDCAFMSMWQDVRAAMAEVYDGTTFEDLVERDRNRTESYVGCYVI